MEGEVQRTKAAYNEALQNLEKISDEIHKLREDQKVNNFHEEVRKLIYYKRVHKRPRKVITFNYFFQTFTGLFTSATNSTVWQQNISMLSK